jgi:hypothetical protein
MEINAMDTKKRIWEGSVGIAIEPRQNNTTGDYFWSYTFTRAYKVGDEFRYADSFTENNTEALGVVMSKGIHFMAETDAEKWLDEQVTKQAA